MLAFVYIEAKNAEIYLTETFFNNYFTDIKRHELPEQTKSTFLCYTNVNNIFTASTVNEISDKEIYIQKISPTS